MRYSQTTEREAPILVDSVPNCLLVTRIEIHLKKAGVHDDQKMRKLDRK